VKDVKGRGFKKVQVAIQGDELRVTSPSRDELQAVMAFLREQDYGLELKFGNYR
jgi:cyclic-di-GMP-binding protein